MPIFLETERLQLRQFTMADLEHLVELDSDPEVMHFITGGIPTPRDEIEREVLPRFLSYYTRYAGYDRRIARPGAQGLHRIGHAAGLRNDDGCERCLPSGNEEGWPYPGARFSPTMAVSHSWR